MPDPAPAPYSWQQAVRDVLNILQILALAYVARLGNVNHEQIERKSTEIVQKQEAAETKVDRVKSTLETQKKQDEKAIEVNLRASWKYLDGIAADTGAQKDIDRANEAKKVLDEFIAHKNGS